MLKEHKTPQVYFGLTINQITKAVQRHFNDTAISSSSSSSIMTRLREEVPVPQSNFQSFIHFVYQERIQSKIKDRGKKDNTYMKGLSGLWSNRCALIPF